MNAEQCERSSLRHATCTYRDWFRFILVIVCALTSHYCGWRGQDFPHCTCICVVSHKGCSIFNYKNYYYYYIVVFKNNNRRGMLWDGCSFPLSEKTIFKKKGGMETYHGCCCCCCSPTFIPTQPPSFTFACSCLPAPILTSCSPDSPTPIHPLLFIFTHRPSFMFAHSCLPIWFTFAHPSCLQL